MSSKVTQKIGLRTDIDLLLPKSDLTYRLIDEVSLINKSLKQSLLNGSIIRKSDFAHVNLSRCDCDGVRIEECRFIDVDFSNIDLRSSVLSNTLLEKCKFDSAYINDCTFVSCQFVDCSFKASIFSESMINSSSFQSTPLRQSTFVLNKFVSTNFKNMLLGDCTFNLQIFKDCSFEKTKINIDSIGLLYGLTAADVKKFDFVFLGKKIKKPNSSDIIDELQHEYKKRKWFLAVAILRLNFNLTSTIFAIREAMFTLVELIKNGILVKKDEITFFQNVLMELRVNNSLPLLNVIEMVEVINKLTAKSKGQIAIRKAKPTLLMLANTMHLQMYEMLEEFETNCLNINEFKKDKPITLKITYNERPQIKTDFLMSQIARSLRLAVLRGSKVIKHESGSFIEIIQTTIFTVFAFQLFLYGLNGCLIQITSLKARFKALKSKKLPSAYRKIALQPRQESPEYLLSILRKITKFIPNLSWLSDSENKGFNSQNIKKVEILDESD